MILIGLVTKSRLSSVSVFILAKAKAAKAQEVEIWAVSSARRRCCSATSFCCTAFGYAGKKQIPINPVSKSKRCLRTGNLSAVIGLNGYRKRDSFFTFESKRTPKSRLKAQPNLFFGALNR